MTVKRYRKKSTRELARKEDTKKIVKIAKQVANKISQRDVELKYDNLNYTAGVSYTWTQSNLSSDIGGGTTDITRIGDKITNKFIDVRWQWQAGDTRNVARMVFYVAREGATSTQPFETDSSVEAPMSHYTHDLKGKYKILYDKTLTLCQNGSNSQVTGFKRIPMYNMVTQYSAASTTVVKNCVYMALVSDSAAITHPNPIIHVRMHYVG